MIIPHVLQSLSEQNIVSEFWKFISHSYFMQILGPTFHYRNRLQFQRT